MSYLRWSKPELIPSTLAPYIERTFISSPSGPLELLSAYPPTSYTGPAKPLSSSNMADSATLRFGWNI